MDNTSLNSDGQPSNSFLNGKRVRARQQAELIGILKGIAADGTMHPKEALYVYEWLNVHRQADDGIIFNELIHILELIDKKTAGTFEDEAGLLELKKEINLLVSGGSQQVTPQDITIAVLKPAGMTIIFEGKTFCFTGKLNFGPRKKAEQITEAMGGLISDSINKSVNYVVCGKLGSRDWTQSSFGEKIRHSKLLADSGHDIVVISEDDWKAALGQ